jgi:hypothetical protein
MNYPTRNHAFTSACTWVLDGPHLRRDDGSGPPQVFPLSEIACCTLDFRPTRADRNCFRCRLTFRTGVRLEILNRTWVGPLNFVDTSSAYVAFIRELLARIATIAPRCDFRAGTSWFHYVVNALATGFITLCFAAIAFFLSKVGLTWLFALKILLLLFYVPTLVYWLVRNRPRHFEPHSIPADVLPTTVAPPN